MAFLFKLITVAILATVASSRSVDQLAEAQTGFAYLATEDTAPAAGGQTPLYYANPSPQSPYALPLNLQLPKLEAPKVPFYTPDPNLNLNPNPNPSAPSYLPDPSPSGLPQFLQTPEQQNYYRVPVPSQELKAPAETSWNPENDAKFYYEIPVILTKQQLPTNQYPKKYNKEIHSKSKPFSSKPKEEIAIVPIDEDQYLVKQKSISKVFDNLAKKENRKRLEAEKVYKKLQQQQKHKLAKAKHAHQKAPQAKPVSQESFSRPEFGQKSSQKLLAPPKSQDYLGEPKLELEGSASGFLEEAPQHEDSKADFSHGLSSKLTASLGIPHAPEHGERLEFHMTGHDGPHSYKWGFDTGKGHNRHFRYEERDKEGIVKGHFGFYDKLGQLKMIHYDSHPHHGFHAEEGHPGDHHEHF